MAAHYIWWFSRGISSGVTWQNSDFENNIPAAEQFIVTWAATLVMEFGVLWYYPMLNLPMLPVDKIMAGEFEWALL